MAGKKVKSIINVSGDSKVDFDIDKQVESKVKELGFDIGTMCSDEPRALAKSGSYLYIAKWRNIDINEYNKLDGFVLCDDLHNGSTANIVILE